MYTQAWACVLVEPEAADDEGGAGEREEEGDGVGHLRNGVHGKCVVGGW